MGMLDKIEKGEQVSVEPTPVAPWSPTFPEAPTDWEPPDAPELPCGDCGCCYFWEDLTGRLHCCQCRRIPVREMAVRFWEIPDPRIGWRPAVFKHWQPFGHLERAERQVEEKAAAKEAF